MAIVGESMTPPFAPDGEVAAIHASESPTDPTAPG